MNDRLHPSADTSAALPAGDASDQAAIGAKKAEKIAYENNKLHKRLCRQVGQAIGDFNMIEDGDKVMVCLSGGKDSYALLDILLTLRERAPIHFDIVAVNLDQKQPNFPADVLPAYLEKLGVPYHIENQDTYSIVKRVVPEGKTTCALCSRLRRGILYRVATELGATKVALGHHRDDILETFFLNMFFGAKLKGMPPKLQSDDGKQIVIRPLAYVKEADLIRYADIKQFPIIPCDLCGSQENLQRKQIKGLMREWEKKFPGRVDNIFSALSTVVPSHLMDRDLFGFAALQASGEADANGDIAFDEEPCSTGAGLAADNAFGSQIISLFPSD
ncbi:MULTISPECIES: tRNA 2-thiocytidine(32) synthetase TtcA [unclassified Herbaspirillum]|uniref:tRNA 2-thiocytidine(32) synthetase TtcA n=1 Tax=unclassified Herbaspirillum TaxID=2624150 RepID=UPI0011724167|nr:MULTISPECIES: tRNA 2-thiocytidine(32) synthetase TtcA [unclassified Herbaspirillum]MBB5390109.1 tRNA 2-thiocytidine biosynthesis protein TtcA [Herbaspirillum sp. SJZ102]TQK09392.1 tRNA s(2)C-32 sulfurtransferase [Herbaspirillum sp. SJZ130]TQK13921.1 tRNA s(2)C-32 sulfurtransferase [Herbaspirillum sp. SJZ106]